MSPGGLPSSAGGGFPLVGAYDGSIAHGDTDVFVQKYNSTGTALLYSTYLGGSKGVDKGAAIAIDRGGNAYIAGTTSSNDFPTTAGAYLAAGTGGGFVAKIGPSGNTLLYSTYVQSATPTAIAVDGSGSAYIAGAASSGFATTRAGSASVPSAWR